MSKRVLVQFDGSNFYHRVKSMDSGISLSKFDYYKFSCHLSQCKNPDVIYYVGEIKKRNSVKLYSGQQSLLYSLEKQGVSFKLGFMLFSNNKWHEKGVDVQIAVDLADKAADDAFDTCFLISSDTDLIPGIKAAQKRGKKIVYVGFQQNLSNALSRICDETMIVDLDMVNASQG